MVCKWKLYLSVLLFTNVDVMPTKPQHHSWTLTSPSFLLLLLLFSFGPISKLLHHGPKPFLFLSPLPGTVRRRRKRMALSYCVCMLNSEMAITVVVSMINIIVILMNFHDTAAIQKPDLLP